MGGARVQIKGPEESGWARETPLSKTLEAGFLITILYVRTVLHLP